MIKTAAFLILIATRLIYQPSQEQQVMDPFTSQAPLSAATVLNSTAKLISFNGSLRNDKVILEWAVAENETAYQFEVEKSTDGKNYRLAALVFGSDLPETGSYQFYEKAVAAKTMYRVKLISKNKQEEYSHIVEITPKA